MIFKKYNYIEGEITTYEPCCGKGKSLYPYDDRYVLKDEAGDAKVVHEFPKTAKEGDEIYLDTPVTMFRIAKYPDDEYLGKTIRDNGGTMKALLVYGAKEGEPYRFIQSDEEIENVNTYYDLSSIEIIDTKGAEIFTLKPYSGDSRYNDNFIITNSKGEIMTDTGNETAAFVAKTDYDYTSSFSLMKISTSDYLGRMFFSNIGHDLRYKGKGEYTLKEGANVRLMIEDKTQTGLYKYLEGKWIRLIDLNKTDLSDYYHKEEIDSKEAEIYRNLGENYYTRDETYNKEEIGDKLNNVTVDAYTKAESDNKYALKEDTYTKDETYNKEEIDSKITTTDLSNYYTKSEIDTQIGDINSVLNKI